MVLHDEKFTAVQKDSLYSACGRHQSANTSNQNLADDPPSPKSDVIGVVTWSTGILSVLAARNKEMAKA